MKFLLLVFGGTLTHCYIYTKDCGEENEEFHEYSTLESCYPSCKFPVPIECPVALERDQCRCKPGFFRDSKGHCTEDCSHEPCYDPNAVRKSCGIPLHCEPSCRERSPSLCETTRCVKNACECKPGFVMDFYTLLCIPASDCE